MDNGGERLGPAHSGQPRSDGLARLYRATQAVSTAIENEEEFFQRIVEEMARLLDVRYAALGLLNEQGQLVQFVTAGLTAAEEAILRPNPPHGRGILGALLHEGKPLRLEEIAADPRSVGFPPGHPPMKSFLGVPLLLGEQVLGRLYVTEKHGGPFTQEDEHLAMAFAAAAAVAIDRAPRFAIERHLRQAATTAVGQLRAVLDAVGSGICVSDENGKFVLVNEPLSELLGTPMAPGMSLLDVVERFASPDELHALVSAGHEETIPARELELSDGRIVRCYSAPVRGERHESLGRALVFTDVSAEHELQQQLVASERLRATGEMAAGIAHDFNNLLATILGRVEVLLGQSRDADTTENLEAIRRAARDGAATVTRMREYGRPVDVGEFRAVDLAQLCNEVVELTRPRWRDEAQRAGKTITAEVRAAPTALVRGDPPALREALVNLIFNAVDAMPSGGKLTFSVGPSSGGVAVEVADTGEGMPDAVARRAFEPFFTTKGARGSGLGLAMVRKVVLGHGGDIQLNSTPGSGTRITLWFPAAVGLIEESAVEPESPTEVGRLGRIVLVDDEQDVLDTTAMLLRKEGHDVRAFRDPRAAVESVMADKPDLVISDLGMPGLNGWDVTRLVKEAWPDVPVVLLTGWGRDITPTQQRERGVAAAVSKPAELDQLRRVIAIMLPTDVQTGPLKVLVVDDSSGFAAALALLLAQDGHVVDRATSVTDGFACVQTKRYDLVLLDLNLPDRPSRDLVDLLATQPARPGICVMSGSAPQAMRDLAPGADYYIEKANVPERLREIYRVARPLASAPPKV